MLVLPEIQLVPGTRTSDFFTPVEIRIIQMRAISLFVCYYRKTEQWYMLAFFGPEIIYVFSYQVYVKTYQFYSDSIYYWHSV